MSNPMEQMKNMYNNGLNKASMKFAPAKKSKSVNMVKSSVEATTFKMTGETV